MSKKNSSSLIHYSIQKQPKKLIIDAKSELPVFNRIVIGITIPATIIFLLWVIYIAVTEKAPIVFFIFLILIITFFIGIAKMIFTFSKQQRNWQLVVDQENKVVECQNENFIVKIERIKSVSLVDSPQLIPALVTRRRSSLKFITDTGEKTLMFPIDSYECGEEIITAIRAYL